MHLAMCRVSLFTIFLQIISLRLSTALCNTEGEAESRCVREELPEESMDAAEIIEYYGYPVEVFDAVTPDGYILKLHRIPFGVNAYSEESLEENDGRPVFFLQHGLLASSADWVTNLPNQSIGFLLADAGFDVWLGNVRGNVYSREHLNYSRRDARYWDFTWDDMAEYDLPTMIDAVLTITGQKSLYYVGHSQGTEIMFVRLATDPHFAKKIRKVFALAPISSVGHVKGLLAFIGRYFGGYAKLFGRMFGSREFLPSNWLSKIFARVACGFSWTNPLCDNVLFQLGGPESDRFNKSRLLVYMSHTPAGTSTYNILHWAQMQRSDAIQKFDFGSEAANRQHYGQNTPPLYDLSRINAPLYLYYSDADWLSVTEDVEHSLLDVVPQRFVKLKRNLHTYNHFDFIWGINAATEIYEEIINIAREHNANAVEKYYRKAVDIF